VPRKQFDWRSDDEQRRTPRWEDLVPTIESSGQDIVGWFTDNATNAKVPKPNRHIFFGGVLG
jgi:hypothetical protein